MNKIISIILCFLLFILPTSVFAEETTDKDLVETVNPVLIAAEVDLPLYPADADASNTNARHACDILNGLVIQKGETFSYNKTIGKRSAETGFVKAGVVGGYDYGGRICKISTAMYQLSCQLALPVIERHAHSHHVDYAATGMDATVDWGSNKDFQFVNNTAFDLQINAAYNENGYHLNLSVIP